MPRKLASDKILFSLFVVLTVFGCIMVYSSSAIVAFEFRRSSLYFFIKQIVSGILGLLAMLGIMNIDYKRYQKGIFIYTFLVLVFMMLILVLFMNPINYVHRWFRWGPLSFQPSELAKIAVIFFLAYQVAKKGQGLNQVGNVCFTILLVLTPAAFIAIQPDLGTAAILITIASIILLVAGLKWRYICYIWSSCFIALYVLIIKLKYPMERISVFLNPWRDAQGYGFQPIQSMVAVGSGGVLGIGLGQSKQKLFYLPKAHTDFIFSVICEELGLIGGLLLLIAFALIFWRGMRIAWRSSDTFGSFLAFGLTIMVVMQALVNISITLNLLPTKGIPLPFISYGGTSLAVNFLAGGILLNISRYYG